MNARRHDTPIPTARAPARAATVALAVANVLALASGCGGSTPPPEPTPPPPEPATAAPEPEPEVDPFEGRAHLRYLHAASAFAQTNLVGHAGETDMPVFPRLVYAAAAPYTEVQTSGGRIEILVQGEGVTDVSSQVNAAPGTHNTVIIVSDSEDPAQIALVPIADNAPLPHGDTSRVRVFHALLGEAELDVCVSGDEPTALLFPRVAYGTGSLYLDVPMPLPARLQLRRPSERDCAGRLVGAIDLAPPEGMSFFGQNLSVVVTGRIGARGRTAVEKKAFVTIDRPPMSETLTLPVRDR